MRDASCHIVTLFNSPNCGSFLQGYALGRLLEDRCDMDVSYVDTGARSLRRSLYKSYLRSLLKLAPSGFEFARRKTEQFEECTDLLNVIKPNECREGALYVFGSDEIWNVSRWEISRYPMLWGMGLPEGFRVAYGASGNGVAPATFSECRSIVESLREYECLSVRDEPTAALVSSVLDRDATVVCDPTLLHDVEFYRGIEVHPEIEEYMLVYSHGGIGKKPEDAEEIKSFAKEKGLSVVSAATDLGWTDISIPCGPLGFLGLFDNASYVVTDTFHGTVFSSIFEKRFASYGSHGSKVQSFLDEYRLESRCIAGHDLEQILNAEPEWSSFRGALAQTRARSLDYIDAFVEGYRNQA